MSNLLRLMAFSSALAEGDRDAAVDRLRAAAAKLPGSTDLVLVRAHAAGVNRADVIWRQRFAGADDAAKARSSDVWKQEIEPMFAAGGPFVLDHHLIYGAGQSGGAPLGKGLIRIALFHAEHNPTPEKIDQMERETASMPRYIPAIKRWQCTRPDVVEGPTPWTYIWEQEYDDLTGLNGPYLMHPSHWGYVDRWFDPEYPEYMIDPELVHTYGDFVRP